MTRTRATSLVLVNWKGVFYERYQLDEHVTALEGSNGAGKTTVLIGCYVVLLPDLSRLRFTNVGETGSTGGEKGLWGRLGEQGRPSYTALELRLPSGERLVAGVQLQRRNEPSVDLNTFMITGLDDSIKLQDVLLLRGESDAVPEMNELKESVARCGGHLETFNSSKDYFGRLFDLGVTPLRLASDEDRTKFNEMLRTSMTGGISRALTAELRDFLLKEETGLADTLKRMRANLEACRRTRTEVKDSRRLEQEISGIYEAGQEMFAAVVHAIRERAEELNYKLQEAERLLREVADAQAEINQEISEGTIRQVELQKQLVDCTTRVEAAKNAVNQLRRANELLARIREDTCARDAARNMQEDLLAKRDKADEDRSRAIRVRDEAQEAHTKAAQGLANSQDGLEELSRRAAEHRMATRNLAEARRLLPKETIDPATIGVALDAAEATERSIQTEALKNGRKLANAQEHRQEFGKVVEALERIVNASVEPVTAFSRAREALQNLRDLDALAKQQPALTAEIPQTRQSVQRQERAQNLARTLGTPENPIATSKNVIDVLSQVEALMESAGEKYKQAQQCLVATQHLLEKCQEQIHGLEQKVATWRRVNDRALHLEQRRGISLRTPDAILTFRSELNGKLDEQRAVLAAAKADEKTVHAQIMQLEHSGGTFSAELLKARDTVEGELLAGRFEELSTSEAALYEALLGPLSQAIAVEDIQAAASALAKSDNRPNSVWLVDGDSPIPLDENGRPPGESLGRDVLVSGTAGSRLTRLPSQPTLGRRARERRIAELRGDETEIKLRIDSLYGTLRETTDVLTTADHLLAEVELLEAGDPSGDLQTATERLQQGKQAEARHTEAMSAAQNEVFTLTPRLKALRDLSQIAWSLDEPDQAVKLQALLRSLAAAKAAVVETQSVSKDREFVDGRLDALREPPLSDAEIETLRERLQEMEVRLDSLWLSIQAMQYVQEHVSALDWTDAQSALDKQNALMPALQAQLNQARIALRVTSESAKKTELHRESVVEAFNKANADREVKEQTLRQDQDQWKQLGVDDASDEAIEAAEAELGASAAEEKTVSTQERRQGEALARLEERAGQIALKLKEKISSRDDANGVWKPAQERWNQLQQSAHEQGILTSAMTPRFLEGMTGMGSPNLYTKAHVSASTLKERLQHAQDSRQVVESVNHLLGPQAQDRSGEVYLDAWLKVRDWLRRRIPAQIAEVDEPLEALSRLRDNLKGLETRLAKQEEDLRGESEDVGKNIEIHIHRAQRQVSRLSDDLKLVHFGSIHGIRLKLERVPHMEKILQALRDGEAQGLLFKPDITIEEALDELFRRYAGRTTGQRLLDYREYVTPKVQLIRQGATEWEEANPMRISTGEAIGVGAALMMVVLTAWERDSNLLRPRRSQGTLRLLFLDEATRLSPDNLSILFDLCQSLHLQAMIAAPEVAKAEGNTTYRLVRRINDSRHEEVIVTGRRVATKERRDDVGSS